VHLVPRMRTMVETQRTHKFQVSAMAFAAPGLKDQQRRHLLETLLGQLWELLQQLPRERRVEQIAGQLTQTERLALEQWVLQDRQRSAAPGDVDKKRQAEPPDNACSVEPDTKKASEAQNRRSPQVEGGSRADPHAARRTSQRRKERRQKQPAAVAASGCGINSFRDRRSGVVFHSVRLAFAKSLRVRTHATTEWSRVQQLALAVQNATATVRMWEQEELKKASAGGVLEAESFMQIALRDACRKQGLFDGRDAEWPPSNLRFTFSVVVPARPWIGCSLETPCFSSLQSALSARHRLQAVRQCAGPRSQTPAEQQSSIWEQVSTEFVAVSLEASPTSSAELLWSRLREQRSLHEPCRQAQLARLEKRASKLAEQERRHAAFKTRLQQAAQRRAVASLRQQQRQAQLQQRRWQKLEVRFQRVLCRLRRAMKPKAARRPRGYKCAVAAVQR